MARVVYDHATLVYPGADSPSVSDLNLDIADGEFLVLVGPSGSGKSTALRMLAGLEEVTDGRIIIGDADVTNAQPKDRDIAMVFQNYALYPHMTVRENMGFALKIAGESKEFINERVEAAAQTLGLTEFLDRKPKALSGGQRQRVAMGRAIVREPQVFLMDEPLSNLDAKLRVQTRTEIAALQRKLGTTTLYVTHDQTEALTMGDRIAVLKDGILQQVGTPRELYETPGNEFVAGFIGSPAMNLGVFEVRDGAAWLGDASLPLPAGIQGSRVTLGFRPEDLEIVGTDSASAEPGTLPMEVKFVEELGSDSYVYGEVPGGTLSSGSSSNPDQEETGTVVVRTPPHSAPHPGDTVFIAPVEGKTHYFDSSSGKRIEERQG